MGKLPPSMRSAKVPFPLLKTSTSSSPSPSSKPQFFPKNSSSPKPKTKTKTKPKPPSFAPKPPPLFQSPALSHAISTTNSLLSLSYPPPPNALIQSFCDAGATPADSVSFVAHLANSHSFVPDKSTFRILLAHSCLSPSEDISPILQVFNLMKQFNHSPDPASLDLSVRALCSDSKSPRIDDACKLVLKSPVKPDEFTYNFLIRRLVKDRPITSVNLFIEQVKDNLSIEPNLVTYTILIDSVCRIGNLREATRLLTILSQNGFKPDAYVYNTIMKGHCILDDCSGVMEVYNKMKDEGVKPDIVTYNTLIYGLSKAGMMPQAKKMLQVMAESGYLPDTATYTSLMNGMCRKGAALEALHLLGEMERKCCVPNECTYNTLIMGLGKAKYLDEAMEIYKVMVSKEMKMDKPTYDSFVRVLCRAGRIGDAYEVFDFVTESKSLNSAVAYVGLEDSLKWVQKRKA
ncbi:hypothetical protein LUZ60_001314 [Juncus effusus]|nr:hypothetical protein LUZ60_001314 [Juncus effusus]